MSVLIQIASSLFVSTCTTGIEMKSHDGVSLDRPVFQRGMPVCVPLAVVRPTSSCRPAMPTVGNLARHKRPDLGCLSLCFETHDGIVMDSCGVYGPTLFARWDAHDAVRVLTFNVPAVSITIQNFCRLQVVTQPAECLGFSTPCLRFMYIS